MRRIAAITIALGTLAGSAYAASSDTMAGMDMAGQKPAAVVAGAATATAGTIEISGAYARPMLPGQPVGGGYLTISNSGAQADRLLSVLSPLAGSVELHEMAMNGQVMTMRRIEGGIEIPPGKTVDLGPGGMHLMFMKVKAPFEKGSSVPVRLVFEKAGPIDVTLPVMALGQGK